MPPRNINRAVHSGCFNNISVQLLIGTFNQTGADPCKNRAVRTGPVQNRLVQTNPFNPVSSRTGAFDEACSNLSRPTRRRAVDNQALKTEATRPRAQRLPPFDQPPCRSRGSYFFIFYLFLFISLIHATLFKLSFYLVYSTSATPPPPPSLPPLSLAGARVYGHTTTVIPCIEYTPTLPLPPPKVAVGWQRHCKICQPGYRFFSCFFGNRSRSWWSSWIICAR